VQDDDFTQRFRELSKTLGALWIDDDRRA